MNCDCCILCSLRATQSSRGALDAAMNLLVKGDLDAGHEAHKDLNQAVDARLRRPVIETIRVQTPLEAARLHDHEAFVHAHLELRARLLVDKGRREHRPLANSRRQRHDREAVELQRERLLREALGELTQQRLVERLTLRLRE